MVYRKALNLFPSVCSWWLQTISAPCMLPVKWDKENPFGKWLQRPRMCEALSPLLPPSLGEVKPQTLHPVSSHTAISSKAAGVPARITFFLTIPRSLNYFRSIRAWSKPRKNPVIQPVQWRLRMSKGTQGFLVFFFFVITALGSGLGSYL